MGTNKRLLQTASQSSLPPETSELFSDPLVVERTIFNSSRTHRYTLFRHWKNPARFMSFVGMNPSGADASHDDRTVTRCIRFAMRWGDSIFPGVGAMYMLNAFALRATCSDELYQYPDPVGPDNDRWIREIAAQSAAVVVAWGKPGGDFDRGQQMKAILRECCNPENVWCFGLNKDGTPVHPLYQRDDVVLKPFPLG